MWRRLAIPFLILTLSSALGCSSSDAGGDDAGTADGVGDLRAGDAELDTLTDQIADQLAGDQLAGDQVDASEVVEEPIPWSQELTRTLDDIVFATVEGKPFFALGFDTGGGLVYDGVSGPKECDSATGKGYLDIQVEKNQLAAEAGANFAYVWGYGGGKTETLVAFEPGFKGLWHWGYGASPSPENDLTPIIYNAFGESDFDTDPDTEIPKMQQTFQRFKERTGEFSPENAPHLPPFEDLPWMSWHPTSRMIGKPGNGFEQHSPELATAFAQTTNMMIGDHYSYVYNRFDWKIPGEAIMAAATGQIGDKGEGYEDWLANDDPKHQAWFSAGWDLANSLVEKRNPGALVWMWIQGYSFQKGVDSAICEKGISDHYAVGPFPSRQYLRKELASVIAAGATGFVFFGWGMASMEEAEEMASFFRALSLPEVYGPALTSKRLDMGMETRYLGEAGYDGLGRVHAVVKWDPEGRHALIVAANPGARETPVELLFPWSVTKVERLNWDNPGFEAAPDVKVRNTTISWTMPKDEGEILRITPLFQ